MATCFKTYDIRGKLPDQLNEEIACKIGHAYARVTGARRVVLGHDPRLSSPALALALAQGLCESGCDVFNLGLCGTEIVYFATFEGGFDGGLMVTASHNPSDYNGLKMVAEDAVPISRQQLRQIEFSLEKGPVAGRPPGTLESLDVWQAYVEFLTQQVAPDTLPELKVVCNAGNGAVGPTLELLAQSYPNLDLVVLHQEPDGTFPHGVPNPLLPEKRAATSQAVSSHRAQLGVAWDGDFDRCFFFDHKGRFVDTYYLIAPLAQSLLQREPCSTILYDPRLTWNTIEAVEKAGGCPVMCRTGHVFFKELMRKRCALYGGEMSGHHYFREFNYCDSGILPWLLLMRLMAETGQTLADLVAESRLRIPISGEINRQVEDPQAALARVLSFYSSQAVAIEKLDGISLEMKGWRFNLRPSNTEPLLRLNVESRGDPELLQEKTQQLLDLLDKQ